MNSLMLRAPAALIIDSEQIKRELILTLKKTAANRSHLRYPQIADKAITPDLNLEGQLDFFFNCQADENNINNIGAACETWNGLGLVDRLTVLDAYRVIYENLLQEYSAAVRTIIFCQLFLHEFVPILTSQ